MREHIAQLEVRVLAGGDVSVDEGTRLLEDVGRDDVLFLVASADRIRRRFVGDEVHLCGIVNAKSGRCSEDCGFCSQSARFATGIDEHGLIDEATALAAAERARADGAEALGLVAAWRGLEAGPELDRVLALVRRLRSEGRVHVDASLGLIHDVDVARRLKEAGLNTLNHNLETARSHFDAVCETHDYDDRLRTIANAREAGLNVCSGGVLGLGETPRQRAELAAELRELDPDIVPLNFLNPIDGTPLGDEHEPLEPIEALKCIAVFRFMLPRHHIMVAGGREVVLKELQPLMYLAGASASMVGDYLTTGGQPAAEELAAIDRLGLRPRERSDGPTSPRPRRAADDRVTRPAEGSTDAAPTNPTPLSELTQP